MRQRHVTRHWHVPPTDQSRIRDGVVGRATWAGRDQRCAVVGPAGDAVDARGLEGFGRSIAGRKAWSRRASSDVPARGELRRK